MTPSQRRPALRARGITRSSPASDSSTERLTFLRLWVSLALRKTLISWKCSRSSSALSRPRSLGMSTETLTSSGMSARCSTSRPSASCGMTSARTKLVTSRRVSPVRASCSTSRTLSSVAMTSGSFWKPSRGPTSRMRTRSGSTLDDPPLVGADADRALALAHLDVEAPLAVVDDLAQRRAGHALRALHRAGNVLDADLEADRRLAVGELLEGEHRRGALHHPDHPGRREDLDRDRAADVGQQPALDGELVLAGLGHAGGGPYTRRPSWPTPWRSSAAPAPWASASRRAGRAPGCRGSSGRATRAVRTSRRRRPAPRTAWRTARRRRPRAWSSSRSRSATSPR